MHIATALAEHGSRKQLRRFAAELGLQADEPGSLRELLAFSQNAVDAAMRNAFADAEARARLVAHLQQLAADGVPSEETDGEDDMQAAEAAARPKAPPETCVDCRTRTKYVFELMACRLCESCERSHPRKYGLVDLATAQGLYGLTEQDLNALNSTGGKRLKSRVFLRSDVEARAASMDTQTHRRAAAEEWKANSFRPDARGNGKTHKWKEWNSHTYQMQKSMEKQHPLDGGSTCVDLSGLVCVGLTG